MLKKKTITGEDAMRSLIIGGTGFVGRHLASRLDTPIVAGRSRSRVHQHLGDIEARTWSPEHVEPDLFSGVDTVFHLAGESVFHGRWTAGKKERIRSSRVDGTRRLVDAIAAAGKRPSTLICSSAIGYYGSRGDTLLTERSRPGDDFLAKVCVDWEREAMRAEEFGVRVVCIRTGVVLGRDGGALGQMLLPFRLGLGGRLGSGNQWMSWIHIEDLVGIMFHAAGHPHLHGPVNGVAPEPVTNRVFTQSLGAALHRPAILPVPACLLKVAVGKFAAVLLASQRVVPEKISHSGFAFSFPQLKQALADLL